MDSSLFAAMRLRACKGTECNGYQYVLCTMLSNYKTTRAVTPLERYNNAIGDDFAKIVPESPEHAYNIIAVCEKTMHSVSISRKILEDEKSGSVLYWSWATKRRRINHFQSPEEAPAPAAHWSAVQGWARRKFAARRVEQEARLRIC